MLEWQRTPSKPWCRVVSLIVAMCVTATSTPAAAASLKTPATSSRQAGVSEDTRLPSEISLPETLGWVGDTYDPTQLTSPAHSQSTLRLSDQPTIIHIQDLHTDPDTQANLATLIEFLSRELDIRLVAVEGAQGYCETDLFSAFPDQAINQRLASLFLQEGLLTGAEYQAIRQPHALSLYGVEDVGLYLAHLRAYHATAKETQQAEHTLRQLQVAIAVLQDQLYPSTIRELEKKTAAYDAEQLDFSNYLEHLLWLADWNHLPISVPEQLARFRRVAKLEPTINTKTVEQEGRELLKQLGQRLESFDIKLLTDKHIAYQQKQLTQAAYFSGSSPK